MYFSPFNKCVVRKLQRFLSLRHRVTKLMCKKKKAEGFTFKKIMWWQGALFFKGRTHTQIIEGQQHLFETFYDDEPLILFLRMRRDTSLFKFMSIDIKSDLPLKIDPFSRFFSPAQYRCFGCSEGHHCVIRFFCFCCSEGLQFKFHQYHSVFLVNRHQQSILRNVLWKLNKNDYTL